MANYEELKKEFLSQWAEFSQSEEIDENAFQERIRQYLVTKTPEETQMLADIMLECVNEDIEKTDNLIHEVRLRSPDWGMRTVPARSRRKLNGMDVSLKKQKD